MAKHLQIVVFALGKELYGVGIDSVQEIVRVPELTEVPDAPEYLIGVINLRGKVLPVIDLRKRLRLKSSQKSKSTRVLITDVDESIVGLMVDSVAEVRKIQPESIEAPPEMIAAVGIEYITGVVKLEEKLIILLNLKKVLSIEDLKKAGQAVAEIEHEALAA